MARSRLDLQELLITLGTTNVYFQPPTNVKMQYPCIVYNRDYSKTEFADNDPYHLNKRYQLTVIDRDPDSAIPDNVENLRLCAFSRFFVADDLNHYVFSLYF
jgi:hypothetical protein